MIEQKEGMTIEKIQETHMTITQAAEYLKLSREHVFTLCKTHKLEGAEKVGNTWLIPQGSVEVYKYIKRKKYKKRK